MQRLLFPLLVTCLPSVAFADIVFYDVPQTRIRVMLQGTAKVNPGGTVTFKHGKFREPLYLSFEDCKIVRTPSIASITQRKINIAAAKRDVNEIMTAARWALKHGQIDEFYEAAGTAWKIDSEHKDVARLAEVKRMIDAPLPVSAEMETRIRGLIQKPDMKIKRSKHFILLHDIPDQGNKKTRADVRLESLEVVYQSFLLNFYSRGVQLEIPKERMMVVLFREHRDYLFYAKKLNPELISASGFFHTIKNISIFYDQGTDERDQSFKQLAVLLRKRADDALRSKSPGRGDLVRRANTIELLVKIDQENQDIEVVSHEGTHQLAANTGLLPRTVMIPSWVHEGLATYFEAPDDATWSGFGTVNSQRLQWYRELEPDRRVSNIDFIVGNQIFDYAGSHDSILHGYGQAWALTHFLLERHFDKFMDFYRRLGSMPPDAILSQDVLSKLFTASFGPDRTALDSEWRTYMRSLRTDVELMKEESN